ncbi:Lysophospholipase NTE1 like protein [Verticillium longisporum]|nr:Lysophospholipase NTE1 like protein [Verticillium longisporum]
MNATTLMVVTVALVSAVSWVVRYRILNMYSRLPPEPQRKEPEIDLFPDTHDEGVKSGLSSYLDEFLSAIKIFGYLERPVFHELTRSMQTRKLIAGETFNLEEEKGFCIVVDGMVEIFVKSGRSFGSPEASANSEGDPLDGEDDALPHGEQYQLLTEAKNGAPMSSLFSIMSLFTEDIKLTSTEAETPSRSTASSANYRFSGVARTSVSRHVSQDAAASMPGTPRFVDVAENNNDRVHEDLSRPSYAIPSSNQAAIPPISLDGVNTSRVPLDPRDVADEDNLFRTSILECMFRAIGLGVGGTVSREPESMEGSPRLFSYDQRRQKAMFGNHNAFGIMDPFDGSVDGDTESLTSGGLALNTPPSAQSLANDLRNDAEIVFFPQGSVLVEQGERNPGLYYVIDGFLDICTTSEESSASILQPGVRASTAGLTSGATPAPDHNIHGRDNAQDKRKKSVRRSVSLIKPGGLAGYIGALSSYRSFIDVVAKTDVYVGFLPRASLERIVDRYPIILLTMAKRLTSLLPRLLLHIDFALDWDQVSAGQVIFHNGDESEAIYIVLNGRLRLVEDREGGGMTARAEFGQGDSVVGPVNGAISLNQSAILNHLGKHAFNKMGKLKLSQYLADLEEKYGLVVYVAGMSLFTQPLFQSRLFL